MTMRYRVIAYNRTTDRVGGVVDVPTALVTNVQMIAGLRRNDREPGELPLDGRQACELGNLLGFRADPARFLYHLEALAQDRLHA
jgi:hypothetical protein